MCLLLLTMFFRPVVHFIYLLISHRQYKCYLKQVLASFWPINDYSQMAIIGWLISWALVNYPTLDWLWILKLNILIKKEHNQQKTASISWQLLSYGSCHQGINALPEITHLRDTMLPSSAGRLLILLDERSRYTRLCNLAMSGGMRDKELSLRCRAVRWVRDHRAVLRLLTRPKATVEKRTHKHTGQLSHCMQPLFPLDKRKIMEKTYLPVNRLT